MATLQERLRSGDPRSLEEAADALDAAEQMAEALRRAETVLSIIRDGGWMTGQLQNSVEAVVLPACSNALTAWTATKGGR